MIPRGDIVRLKGMLCNFLLSKLDHYLHNSKFVIRTDHEPLKHIFTSPINMY